MHSFKTDIKHQIKVLSRVSSLSLAKETKRYCFLHCTVADPNWAFITFFYFLIQLGLKQFLYWQSLLNSNPTNFTVWCLHTMWWTAERVVGICCLPGIDAFMTTTVTPETKADFSIIRRIITYLINAVVSADGCSTAASPRASSPKSRYTHPELLSTLSSVDSKSHNYWGTNLNSCSSGFL